MRTFLHSGYHSGLSKVAGTPRKLVLGLLRPRPLSPGAVCDFRLSYGRVLSRSSKIIVVNRDRKEMLINSDIFWKPQEAVQGEPLLLYVSLFFWPLLTAGLSWVLVTKAWILPQGAPSWLEMHICPLDW